MKCLLKYRWVKLPRAQLPQGKGVLGYWSRLAARAAFRKGTACYCGYHNEVVPGMWSGGIVGLKSILGVRRRAQALQIMDQLQSLGYIRYSLDQKTKRLDYQICDWIISCSGQGCSAGTVYATDGYGFLCLPRNITQRLVKHNYKFEEADALLDLWCHTTWQDSRNAFSFLAPAVQFGEYGAVLTLEYLGQRWGWERSTFARRCCPAEPREMSRTSRSTPLPESGKGSDRTSRHRSEAVSAYPAVLSQPLCLPS